MRFDGIVMELEKRKEHYTRANKPFEKAMLVLQFETSYRVKRVVAIDFIGKSASLLDNVSKGQYVSVDVEVSSREWKGKYYHNINGFRLNVLAESGTGAPTQQGLYDPGEDDLPF